MNNVTGEKIVDKGKQKLGEWDRTPRYTLVEGKGRNQSINNHSRRPSGKKIEITLQSKNEKLKDRRDHIKRDFETEAKTPGQQKRWSQPPCHVGGALLEDTERAGGCSRGLTRV